MPSFSIDRVWYTYHTKADLRTQKFQKILKEAYHRKNRFLAICSCQGEGEPRVELEIILKNGIYHLRHKSHKPHHPDCPLFLLPGGSGVSDVLANISVNHFRDDTFMDPHISINRSERVRSVLAIVSRRAHDRLAWKSFANRHSMISWSDFLKEVTRDFYTLETKEGPNVFKCLKELELEFFVGCVKKATKLGKLDVRSNSLMSLHIFAKPDGWSETARPEVRVGTIRGALNYCSVFGHFVQAPYMILGLVNAQSVITRCVLLPLFSRDNQFCFVESNQERHLAKSLLGSAFTGWFKPADLGTWSEHPIANEFLPLQQLVEKPPRMDFLTKVEEQLVIIELFGLDTTEYLEGRRHKLQFAHKYYLPNGICYWDCIHSLSHFDNNPNCPIHNFTVHNYLPDGSHDVFNINDL